MATVIPQKVYQALRASFVAELGPLAVIIPKSAFNDANNVVGFGLDQPWDELNLDDPRSWWEHRLECIGHFEFLNHMAVRGLPANIPPQAHKYIGPSGKLLGLPPGGWLVCHHHDVKTEAFVPVLGQMVALGDFPGATDMTLPLPERSQEYYPCKKGRVLKPGDDPLIIDRGMIHAAYNPLTTWAAFLEFATLNDDEGDNRFVDPRLDRSK